MLRNRNDHPAIQDELIPGRLPESEARRPVLGQRRDCAKEDPSKVVECLVGRDRERGILIVVRDPDTGFPGQFPVAPLGKMFIPIKAAEAI